MGRNGSDSKSSPCTRSQKISVEFLLINHPLDCPFVIKLENVICKTLAYGKSESKDSLKKKRTFEPEDIGPNIQLHMNRCILCYRCVMVADQLTDDRVHGVMDRRSF
jgi:NADH-quinone oxidoreductase subunit G